MDIYDRCILDKSQRIGLFVCLPSPEWDRQTVYHRCVRIRGLGPCVWCTAGYSSQPVGSYCRPHSIHWPPQATTCYPEYHQTLRDSAQQKESPRLQMWSAWCRNLRTSATSQIGSKSLLPFHIDLQQEYTTKWLSDLQCNCILQIVNTGKIFKIFYL